MQITHLDTGKETSENNLSVTVGEERGEIRLSEQLYTARMIDMLGLD